MKKFGVALAIATAAVGAAHAADLPTNEEAAVSAGELLFKPLDLFEFKPRGLPPELRRLHRLRDDRRRPWLQFQRRAFQWVVRQWRLQLRRQTELRVEVAVDAQRDQPIGGRDQHEGTDPGFPGWSLVGALETGFDPYFGNLVNGPRSLVQNNGQALVLQNANSDLSRAGQFDNSVGYIGLSNQTFGTLTVGRVTSLTLDGVIGYDPMGGSYAFSPLGYSGSYAGFGDTETNRANTGVKYRVAYENFHGGGLVQWGGYAQGNGTPAYTRAISAPTLKTTLAASCRWTSLAVTLKTRSAFLTSRALAPRSPAAPSRARPVVRPASRCFTAPTT